MKRDEGAIAIARREERPGVEEQSVGRPVRGKVRDVSLLRRAATHLPAVATVLGAEHFFLLLRIEVAIGPAEVVAALHVKEFFGGELGALLGRVQLWPISAAATELIATVLHHVQFAVTRTDRDRDRVPNAACKVLALRL